MKYWGLLVFGIAAGLFASLSAGAGTTSTLLGLLFGALGGSLVSWFSKQVAPGRKQPAADDRGGAPPPPVIDVVQLNEAVGGLASGLLVGLVLGLAWPTVDMYLFLGTRSTAQAKAIAGAWATLPEEVRRNPDVAKTLIEKTSQDLGTPRPQAGVLDAAVDLHKAAKKVNKDFADKLTGDTKEAMQEMEGHVAFIRYRDERIKLIRDWIKANSDAANTDGFADRFERFITQEGSPR